MLRQRQAEQQITAWEAYLNGSDDEQVLQVVVVAEAAVLQHNLLQKLNEFTLEASLHEGFDCH